MGEVLISERQRDRETERQRDRETERYYVYIIEDGWHGM